MAKIEFRIEGGDAVRVEARAGEPLLEAARRAGIAIDAPCGGNGTCGKCRARVEAGVTEAAHTNGLAAEDVEAGWRLACQTKAAGDAAVFVPAGALAYRSRIRITDISGEREKKAFDALRARLDESGMSGGHGVETVALALAPPSPDDARADKERLLAALAAALNIEESEAHVSLFALRTLPRDLREADFKAVCVIRRDAAGGVTVLRVWGADAFKAARCPAAGLAVDIGTTTVSMLLVDLRSGVPLAGASCGNAQIRYGADVINRIIESGKKGGLERLRKAVAEDSVAMLARRVCVEAGVEPEHIVRLAFAGNTTMTTLLLGAEAGNIRLEPYVPPFFQTRPPRALELGIPAHPDAEALLAPAVGSYVGGDITAGIFSSGLYQKEAPTLFIDLGTNGEIVLGCAEFMMACACSAGPAFEGGEISCGMRATGGAIEACTIDDATLELKASVIGAAGQKIAGLCGSGLIDITGELFRAGAVNSKGKFVKEGARIVEDEYGVKGYVIARADESESGRELVLSEIDIDNFIRAKGAIFSAIRTMLQSMGMTQDSIAEVIVAGGIGSGINIDHAILIGMFPNIPVEKYSYIGNSSLTGAYAMLTSQAAARAVDAAGAGVTYLELSSDPSYMDEFVAACFLPHTDATLFAR